MTFDEIYSLTDRISSDTAFSRRECLELFTLCRSVPRHTFVIEIGCQYGRSSSVIAQTAIDGGFYPIHIDPWNEAEPGIAESWFGSISPIGNPFMLMRMKSKEALPILQHRFDANLLLVDGDHSLEGVTQDMFFAEAIVREGGYMICHDYGRDSLEDVMHGVNRHVKASGKWEYIRSVDTLGVWRRRYQ